MRDRQHKVKKESNQQELCLIFSRYPEPGLTKTRLIPSLGGKGAAELQRWMTEKVVAEAGRLAAGRPGLCLELAISGGDERQLAAWLGSQLRCREQVGNDLGARLAFAFGQAFDRGFQRVVVVGGDCPELTSDILSQAFDRLRHKEMVLGPAADGGYYLMGLRRAVPQLFQGITWGSGQVLRQTLRAAAQVDMEAFLLPRLADVDRPADLALLPTSWRSRLP